MYCLEEALKFYKSNRLNLNGSILYLNCFEEIACTISNPTDEEYKIIADASLETYMDIDIVDAPAINLIAGFISRGYRDKKISLQEIQNATRDNIADAFFWEDYRILKGEV